MTLKEIAKKAGVSPSTVSNVLNNKDSKVSKKTAEKIEQIIKENNYVPNSYARSLSQRSSRIIAGVIVGDKESLLLKDPYNTEFFGEIINCVQKQGYYFMLRSVQNYDEILHSLRSWKIDGAIIVGLPDRYVKLVTSELKIPLIFTDSYTEAREVSNIGINDYKGGVLAAELFIKNGHKKLAFVSYYYDKKYKGVVSERYNGFMDTLLKNNITNTHEFFVNSNQDDDSVSKIANQLSSKRDEITGIFATSDRLAFSLMDELNTRGVSIPNDMSVVGFDDLYICKYVLPKLTTIRQDIVKKAQLASDSLFRQLSDSGLPAVSAMLDVQVVERNSVLKLI